MDMFGQTQMRLDELSQPGLKDSGNYFCERDIMFRTAELKVLVVNMYQIGNTAATPSRTIYGGQMQTLEIYNRQLHIPAVTSRP
jgi:hypothetical protein